jgi:hypothetical protein
MEDVQFAVSELKKAALEYNGDKKTQDAIGHLTSYLLLLVSSKRTVAFPIHKWACSECFLTFSAIHREIGFDCP